MRASFFALLALACLTSTGARALAPASLGAALPPDCAKGYHEGQGGACFADVVQVDRYCPAGTVYAPQRDGWTCEIFPLDAR